MDAVKNAYIKPINDVVLKILHVNYLIVRKLHQDMMLSNMMI